MLTVLLVVSCSTKKNTSGTRFYHSLTARFNTLYNGQKAFLEAEEAQLQGHKENYSRMLPMYLSTNKTTAALTRNTYQTTIEKCEKAIKVHSIKKRPTSKPNKTKTAKEKAYMARKEFNPYLYRAWLMMADAQFRQGEFFESASTLNYIIRLYSTQPEITAIAKARLARCYVAQGWAYDAEDVLQKLGRDSLDTKGKREQDNTMAGYLILTQQYEKAIPYLKETIRHTRKKRAKSRMLFLMGQLYQSLGKKGDAYMAYAKVIRTNPPYEMAFNARMLQAEVMPSGRHKQMISKLQRMAKSDKNQNYLDRIYYAIGNIYLGVQDTARCISAYEKGVLESTQNGNDKATLLLKLSELYWEMENYIEATRTYKQCVSILDRDHERFQESDRRSTILNELEPHLSAIKLQDSLMWLASLPEVEQNAAIDRVIEALKKKEKETEKLAAKKENATGNQRPNTGGGNQGAGNATQPSKDNMTTPAGNRTNGDWYFYNSQTVAQGKQEFTRRWGRRKNEDYWRLSQKAGLVQTEEPQEDIPEEEADSLFGSTDEGDLLSEEEKAKNDSLANDPHQREYYLKQIPTTPEMQEAANNKIASALFRAGILEQERLENFPLAERTMQRLLREFPDREGEDNIYYHLFLLYGRLGEEEKAESYKDSLLQKYPESDYALLLKNPNYTLIAQKGKQVEDSMYRAAYQAYQEGDYTRVEANYQFCNENFPKGENRSRMLFIRAMSQLYGGARDSFMVSLQKLINGYPKEEVTELAQSIIKGLKNGRLLSGDPMSAGGIWARRAWKEDGDSTQATPELSAERYSNFAFILAWPTGELDEKQLLFEIAKYNFTNYMVRNFDIEQIEDRGLSMMAIKGFLSYDEVHAYAQTLYADGHMSTLLEGIRTLLISEENLKLIGTEYSFDEYKEFYEQNFAPLEVPEDLQIDEPTDLEILDPDDVEEETQEEGEGEETDTDEDYDDFPFDF